ncbi:MAG: S-layer homology domain-containing protein [Clostridia bacterium]|nr:S-layer homology domain-containing protein [Clostridia bacterium]
MKKLRNALAFVLAVMMVVTAIPFTAAAQDNAGNYGFADFPTGWSWAAMAEAVENGLVTGFGDGMVRPGDLLTRAQMAAIINRAFGAETRTSIMGMFADVAPEDWFYTDIAKAVKMQTFAGDSNRLMRPYDPITRQDAVLVIARALVIASDKVNALSRFTDGGSVSEYAAGAMNSFVERGYINGYEDGTIRPHGNITREEFAQIMDNIFAKYVRTDGAFALGTCEGEVVLTGDSVILRDTYVTGDLIIGDGAGNTNISLLNVRVDGRIIFRGGAEKVTLKNITMGDMLVVNDVNNDIHGPVEFQHYSTEAYFKDAVYNTPVTFLDRTPYTPSASGKGLGSHDTYREGVYNAGTGITSPGTSIGGGSISGGGAGGGAGGGTGGTTTKTHTVTFTVSSVPGATFADNTTVNKTLSVKDGAAIGSDKYPQAVKSGHAFGGWFIDADNDNTYDTNETIVNINTPIKSDLVLKPRFTPIVVKHTVTFVVNGTNYPVEVVDGALIQDSDKPADIIPEAGVDPADVRVVWLKGTEEFDFTTPVTEDITLTATFWVDITFDYADPTTDVVVALPYGTSFTDNGKTLEALPEGYVQWVDGENAAFTCDTKVYAHTRVYPKPADPATKHAVAFYDNNGAQIDETAQIIHGETVNFPAVSYDNENYRLEWFNKDTSDVVDHTVAYTVVAPVNFQYRLIKLVTVNFFAADKTTPLGTSGKIDEGTTLDATLIENLNPACPKPGYETYYTLAWKNVNGDAAFDTTAPVELDDGVYVISVYAHWTPVALYTVTYRVDGSMKYQQTDIMPGFAANEQAHSDSTRTFTGWYVVEDNTVTDTKFDFGTAIVNNYVLEAKFTVDVTINVPGATPTVVTIPYSTKLSEKDGFTMPVLPEGYTHWYYIAGGAEQIFTADTVVTAHTAVYAKPVVPEDKWTVTFIVNGTQYGDIVEVEKNTAIPADKRPQNVVPEAGVDPDDVRVVWYKGTEVFSLDTAITEDTILTARFEVDVIFKNEGTQCGVVTVEYGTALGTNFPADPVHPQYPDINFMGWFIEGTTTELEDTTVITKHTTVNAKWPLTYTVRFFDNDGNEMTAEKLEGVTSGEAVNFPSVTVPAGYELIWVLKDTDTKVEAPYAIYQNTDIQYKLLKLIKVNFIEYCEIPDFDDFDSVKEATVKDTTVSSLNAFVTDADIEAATDAIGLLSDTYFSYGIDITDLDENHADLYGSFTPDEIWGGWYYANGNTLEKFDATVEITEDLLDDDGEMNVYYGFKQLALTIALESMVGLDLPVNIQWVLFDEDRQFAQSILDALYSSENRASIETALNVPFEKAPETTVDLDVAGMKIQYSPITKVGNDYRLMNPVIDYRLIDLLGEDTIRDYTDDSIEDLLTDPSQIQNVTTAIETILTKIATSDAELIYFDNYIMAPGHEAFKNQIRNEVYERALPAAFDEAKLQIEEELKAQFGDAYTNFMPTDQEIMAEVEIEVEAEIDALINDPVARRDAIREICEDDTMRRTLAEHIDESIQENLEDPDADHGFVDEVVATAKTYYSDIIEEFIASLKTNDTFYYDEERQFIVYALYRKLNNTTYDEVVAKLPAGIKKVLEEEVLERIFNETLGNYKAEVEVAKNALQANAATASGNISCFAHISINPITDVVAPAYDKYWEKVDDKAAGFEWYEQNPYIQIIEDEMIHYNTFVAAETASGDYSGYKLKTVSEYYGLVYKFAVLTYDAGQWFFDNVPENEIDDVLELAVDRIGGYYDRLTAKFSALSTGKFDAAYDKARAFMNKLIGKDTRGMVETETESVVGKIDGAYAKAIEVVLEKSGLDLSQTITVTVANTCDSITIAQGGKTIVKTIPDIAKDIEAAGHEASVNGTVITVDGKAFDVVDYLTKITAKSGRVFEISFADNIASGAVNTGLIPDYFASYKLNFKTNDYAEFNIGIC